MFSERCQCLNNSSCDAETGRCACAAGWTGADCSRPCEPGTYGPGCSQRCPGYNDTNSTPCDPVTGNYSCPSGFTGATCEYPCPLGTFGLNCREKCDCKNNADCHHVTGVCQCPPGWRGARCGEACGAGWWGARCSQPCRCERGAACRANDGFCRCPPGYTGTYCEQFCPEGYFGDHCMEACNCSSVGNWVCHPVKGCICHRNFIGENCDIHASDAIVIDRAEGSSNGLTVVMIVLSLLCAACAVLVLMYYRKRVRSLKREIAHVHYTADPNSQPVMIVLSLLCAACAVLVLMYYRKRVRSLKREIAHVHYTADPNSQPEQQHFDNPVYSFQTGARDDSATLLNNAHTILNNLGAGKLSNAAMEKLRMRASGSTDTSSSTYDPLSSLKNKDADANNPNLYHFIDDDNKLDHVYDEIKHKEGYEIEYDHLNYTPPVNKWKQHYQRMANGFPPPQPPGAAASEPPSIPPLPKLSVAAQPPPPPVRDDPLSPDSPGSPGSPGSSDSSASDDDAPAPPRRDDDTLPVPPKRLIRDAAGPDNVAP